MLWCLFSLLGLGILGIMPATVSLFTVVRKWLQNQDDHLPILNIFWHTFRQVFWKANGIGILIGGIGYFISINYLLLLGAADGALQFVIAVLIVMTSLLFVVLVLYIIPVYTYFEMTFSTYFTLAVLIGISFPLQTITMLIAVLCWYFVLCFIPGFIPFFSVSVFSTMTMWMSMNIFHKIGKRLAEC